LQRDLEAHLRASVVAAAHEQTPADQKGPLAHAAEADTGAAGLGLADAQAVVANPQHDAPVRALERQFDASGLGVAGDVGETLLRDSIQREILLGNQRRQVGIQLRAPPATRSDPRSPTPG
jgi:hypothetical protein